jgi:flagellar motility protein MotE (MotC chaperone)
MNARVLVIPLVGMLALFSSKTACASEEAAGSLMNLSAMRPGRLTDAPVRLALKMMEEVRRKEKELKQRENEIRQREMRLKELKAQIELKIKELEEKSRRLNELEQRVRGFVTQTQNERLNWLAKVYESTPPEQAASSLSRLDPETAAQVLVRMNRRKAGRLWGYLDPQKAAQLTDLLTRISPEGKNQ